MKLHANAETLTLAKHGARWFAGAARGSLSALETILAGLAPDQAGIRIQGLPELRPLLAPHGEIGSLAANVLGADSRAVRAILFDKTSATNWSLAWHQDRTICVKRELDVAGFGPWSTKAGLRHVAPPFDLLKRMLTMRVHLDEVDADNAPLLIAPGSHLFGRVPTDEIEDVVRRCGVATCLAKAGDVWLYATPLLHASEAARRASHRRVLQVDFAAFDLPGGLEWLGV